MTRTIEELKTDLQALYRERSRIDDEVTKLSNFESIKRKHLYRTVEAIYALTKYEPTDSDLTIVEQLIERLSDQISDVREYVSKRASHGIDRVQTNEQCKRLAHIINDRENPSRHDT